MDKLFDRLSRCLVDSGSIPELLKSKISQLKEATFVQVGAFDGRDNDLIYPYAIKNYWKGIAIEPNQDLIPRLTENYSQNNRVQIVNAAISHLDGYLSLYKIRMRPGLPPWSQHFSSLSIDLHKKYPQHFSNDDVERVEVKCYKPQTLLKEKGIEYIDILSIDCEGHDWIVLKGFDLRKYRPKIIIFEHKHLSSFSRLRAVLRLKSLGYRLTRDGGDICAY